MIRHLCTAATVLFLSGAGLPLVAGGSGSIANASHTAHDNAPAAAAIGAVAQETQTSAGDGASAALWEKAKTMYQANDFAQAAAAAGHVTSPSLKKEAAEMIDRIRAYVAALQDGAAAEGRRDSAAAIKAYSIAARIKNDGPGEPVARIARIQQQTAATLTPEQVAQAKDAQRLARAAQGHAKATQLVAKGVAQEAANNFEGALASFRAAQLADPANGAAADGMGRIKARLASVSDAGASAATAIRDFYAGQYEKAEGELSTLTAVPNAPSRGAAYFYLGAAHFYRALLEAGQPPEAAALRPEVQAALKQARALGYVPLPQFVSPTLMHLWQGAS